MIRYALLDCNNCYASCERLQNPDLRNKPIVVKSNNDGCVIARSDEAKALGVPMGAVVFEWRDFFKKNNVIECSSNYELYEDLTDRVMSIAYEYGTDYERYSIDETFIEFRDLPEDFDYEKMGREMVKKIQKWTGMPVSIGFADTKALAKLANRVAKKLKRKTSVYHLRTDNQKMRALKWLDVGDIWGVGRKHKARLNAEGVNTALDFVNLPEDWVRTHMSVVGLRLQRELNGVRSLELEKAKQKKNIATTRSFEGMYTELDQLRERVITFAITCAEKLRYQESNCTAIMVFVHTNSFRTDLDQYSRNIIVQIPFPTNSSIEIGKYALLGLDKIFRKGYSYKKAGVIVLDIVPENPSQITLFENSNPKHKELMKTIDEINDKYGRGKIKLATQNLQKTWIMKQDDLSKCFTTRMNELIEIS
jgi:DNA polymerase V